MLAVMHAPAKILASFSLAAATLLLAPSPSRAAAWKTNVSYGANTIMDLYVPDNVAASPAVVVALHDCSGNAGSAHSWFQSLADSRKFIIIAPGAGGNCFDAGLGRNSRTVLDAMRGLALLSVAALAAFAWRSRKRGTP